MPSFTQTNVKIDRPHRYRLGQLVRHVDSPVATDVSEVTELTYRVRDGVAYPTYTLTARGGFSNGESFDDILCTLDLIGAYERQGDTSWVA